MTFKRYTEEEAKALLDDFYKAYDRIKAHKDKIIEIEQEHCNDEIIEKIQCCFDQGYGHLLDDHVYKLKGAK